MLYDEITKVTKPYQMRMFLSNYRIYCYTYSILF